MAQVTLDDFKVRVLGSRVGTDARVRVWATFGDGMEQWNVAGVSENIIEASWLALLDGLNYKIMKEMR
jgi:2-isopropylmalate synthase